MTRDEVWKIIEDDMEKHGDPEDLKVIYRAALFILKKFAEDIRQIRLHYANDDF